MTPPRRRIHPHAQLHLPPLDGPQALVLANALERIADAIWRAHGHAMREVLERDPHVAYRPTLPFLQDQDDDLF